MATTLQRLRFHMYNLTHASRDADAVGGDGNDDLMEVAVIVHADSLQPVPCAGYIPVP